MKRKGKLARLELVPQGVEGCQGAAEAIRDHARGELVDLEGPKRLVLFLSRGAVVGEVAVRVQDGRHGHEDTIYRIPCQ